MRTIHNWRIVKDARELEVVFDRPNRPRLAIAAGDADDVYVFQNAQQLLVLSVNRRFDYCGLQVFDAEGVEVFDVFAQGSEQIVELVGPRGLDLSEINIARRLAEYAQGGDQ